MVRRYGDPVMVRAAEPETAIEAITTGPVRGSEPVRDDVPPFRPGAFLWRGRVYVVRDVLGHWRERRAWWADAAAAALHGEGAGDEGADDESADDESADKGASADAGGDVVGRGPGAGRSSAASTLEAEREVWRVEASRGRTFGSGVFDLCREVPAAADEQWRLLSVSD